MITIISIFKDNHCDLVRTLASLNSAEFEYQIVVVDGSSTSDDSVIDYLYREFDDVVYIRQSSKGIFSAMNEGLSYANYQWTWFLNAGDTASSLIADINFSSLLSESYDMHIFSTRILTPHCKFIGYNPPLFNFNSTIFLLYLKFLRWAFWPCHQSILFKTAVHKEYIYPNTTIGADQAVISLFLRRPFLYHPLVLSSICTDGVSSIPASSFESFRDQLYSSLCLLQMRRVFRLPLVQLFVFCPTLLDQFRLMRYRVLDLFLFRFCRRD